VFPGDGQGNEFPASFTHSVIEALRDVDAVGREAELASEFFFAASSVPALKISGFQFTGASDH